MGSCASTHRNTQTDMKLGLSFGSKTDKLVIPPSPIKDKPSNGNFRIDDIALKSQWSPSRSTKSFKDNGSKEEAFFDSKLWLESDNEDDFYSVNGDFTPSRGNTPIHQSYSIGSPNVNKTLSQNSIPVSVTEPSPTPKKKKLLELFRESLREDQHDDENMANGEEQVKQTIHDVLPKSAQSAPYISGTNSRCGSERTMNEDPVSVRGKTVKSAQGCLPGLASCRSFSERRRKMSPAVAANGKP
ncbi:hypothetical protein L6164_004976 [Bauhinia variegata]|uniref:Uncharacterized protein n=1 Tax=Bauhinia variegata TaxID=167791 RepID=A0ACB9PPP8_BAUVA|nr:hypothetical protein L6164_004976 [Bauhinia variegata]